MTTPKSVPGSPLMLTALSFSAGAATGFALGFFSGFSGSCLSLLNGAGGESPLELFLVTYTLFAFFSAAVFLFGTSVIGRKVIPLFAFFRGLLLACSAASLLCAGVGHRETALQIALPAAFTVPAFFLLAEDGILSSDIIRLCSASGLIRNCDCVNLPRVITAAALLAAGTAAKQLLVPLIL